MGKQPSEYIFASNELDAVYDNVKPWGFVGTRTDLRILKLSVRANSLLLNNEKTIIKA